MNATLTLSPGRQMPTLGCPARRRTERPMREDLTAIAPRILDAIKDLGRVLGWSRAWSQVKNDTAAAPVYDWLLTAEILIDVLGEEPRITNYRLHYSELVSMAKAALRVLGGGIVDRHHEGFEPLQRLRNALAEIGEVAA